MVNFKTYFTEATKKDILFGFDKIYMDRDTKGKMIYGIIYDDESGWFFTTRHIKQEKLPETAVYVKQGIFKQPGEYGKQTTFYITDQKLLNNLKKIHDDYWNSFEEGIAPPNGTFQAYNNYFKFFVKNGNTPNAPVELNPQ